MESECEATGREEVEVEVEVEVMVEEEGKEKRQKKNGEKYDAREYVFQSVRSGEGFLSSLFRILKCEKRLPSKRKR